MSKQVRVPIRVRRSNDETNQDEGRQKRAVVESDPAVVEPQPIASDIGGERGPKGEAAPSPRQEELASSEAEQEIEALKDDLEMWRDRALRLQAEIENFRKRQRRLADDRIEADRGRLLRNFLRIADDLERALAAEENGGGSSCQALHEGVRVTYRSVKQLLKQEGVEPIAAEGEVFDPTWHEAVGTVSHEEVGVRKNAVVDVTQRGYRLDGRLLRPARVIVAK